MPAAVLVFAVPAIADGNSIGPPGSTIYPFDVAYRTVATPTSLPGNGPTDTIYVFPDCPSCASVSEAAPGYPGYNGGRWRVVQAFGITSQLTNADDVVTAASALHRHRHSLHVSAHHHLGTLTTEATGAADAAPAISSPFCPRVREAAVRRWLPV